MAIPILSMRDLPAPDFARALGASFRTYGFAMVSDHGMDNALIARGWDQARAFFALPDAAKRRHIVPGGAGQRGYTAFGVETAKGAAVSDLKEFWHVGRDLPAGSPLAGTMPPNLWPAEIPGFAPTFRALFAAFDAVGGRILSAIAVDLGLDADWFADPVRDGNSILRLLHYPPVAPTPAGLRAEAHEDINLITLLLGAEEAGLQLLSRDGQWIDVAPPPGALVVNVGDMLQRLTNHALPSTSHRVVNPPAERAGVPRYSMPFFLHLRPDWLIEALPQCTDAANPARHPPITAQAYLHERLAEIGLVKA
ncbi:isopenicillin N synthase family oxygenase [Sphingobium sufflavum]|uniref:isopenicillin N synthase family dioxygenase n=1 Tax=Sphingobium sufflavum TaxID=1129547 RepID=UPI001F392CDC|nr:2-oxoglutarate and iron-dependent oxygenase domain-containing protein [Sphingobium sufflavum]MCE7796056.1 isopenicillin N synthase family oxygenase [Sphingobium sufflavum]